MSLIHEELEYYVNQFNSSLADKRQPTQNEKNNINNLINALVEEETEETRFEYRTVYKIIWESYHNNNDWHKHIAAIIGKWITTHRDGFYADEIQQTSIAWIINAIQAKDWDDALAAIPIDVMTCWGL